MLDSILHFLSLSLMAAGAFFMLSGSLGILRMPDFFSRLHAAGVTDSFGAPLVLLGVAINSGFTLFSVKILLLIFFLLVTNPTATHVLAKSAIAAKIKPLTREKK